MCAQIDLSGNKLGPAGAAALAPAIAVSTSLTSLDLSANYVGPELGVVMADALRVNASLTNLK